MRISVLVKRIFQSLLNRNLLLFESFSFQKTTYLTDGSFDVVHMSNALDHCFDPIFGLMQLISVCKIGGKVILRHNENEALNEHILDYISGT